MRVRFVFQVFSGFLAEAGVGFGLMPSGILGRRVARGLPCKRKSWEAGSGGAENAGIRGKAKPIAGRHVCLCKKAIG